MVLRFSHLCRLCCIDWQAKCWEKYTYESDYRSKTVHCHKQATDDTPPNTWHMFSFGLPGALERFMKSNFFVANLTVDLSKGHGSLIPAMFCLHR